MYKLIITVIAGFYYWIEISLYSSLLGESGTLARGPESPGATVVWVRAWAAGSGRSEFRSWPCCVSSGKRRGFSGPGFPSALKNGPARNPAALLEAEESRCGPPGEGQRGRYLSLHGRQLLNSYPSVSPGGFCGSEFGRGSVRGSGSGSLGGGCVSEGSSGVEDPPPGGLRVGTHMPALIHAGGGLLQGVKTQRQGSLKAVFSLLGILQAGPQQARVCDSEGELGW